MVQQLGIAFPFLVVFNKLHPLPHLHNVIAQNNQVDQLLAEVLYDRSDGTPGLPILGTEFADNQNEDLD